MVLLFFISSYYSYCYFLKTAVNYFQFHGNIFILAAENGNSLHLCTLINFGKHRLRVT